MPVLGKRPNVFAAPVAKAYRPTMRDQVANLFSRALGDNYQSNELARGLFGSSGLGGGQGNLLGGLGLLDLTPIGAAFALEEAGRQIGGGQPVTGAANVALGMVPIPAVAKGGKAVVRSAARRVAGKAAKAAPAPKPSFTAYHGSPHTFDQFDTAKIGTGEGAQAYGHGLYFAENEGVAREYRDKLAGGSAALARTKAAQYGDPQRALEETNRYLRELEAMPPSDRRDQFIQIQRDKIGQLQRMIAGEPENPGSMYQVRINADPNDFLDWDRPLSEQSERVRAAVAKTAWADQNATADDLLDVGLTGENAYKRMVTQRGGTALPGLSRQPQALDASGQLREAGVPGVKYLDQGSRGAGEGSRNFVVFDPRIIDIMKRYGVAAPVAAAILAGTMQPPKGKEPGA
jgi:hypothetical protein